MAKVSGKEAQGRKHHDNRAIRGALAASCLCIFRGSFLGFPNCGAQSRGICAETGCMGGQQYAGVPGPPAFAREPIAADFGRILAPWIIGSTSPREPPPPVPVPISLNGNRPPDCFAMHSGGPWHLVNPEPKRARGS